MSYIGLPRKYRPQRFDELVGQERVATTLRNALQGGRLAHAYLFAGPRGVGKTSAARILAKAVNCAEGTPGGEPCNRCELCAEITAGQSMDVLEIDGASNRGVDEVRALRERVKYAPSRGKEKVYIIDEVHMLTKEAFNALLKTLEEPPAHVRFVFATTEPHRVPATVLSRTQRFDFRRIGQPRIREHLEQVVRAEGVEWEEEALGLIARRAEGSLRDALGFLDQVLSFADGRASGVEAARILGVVEDELYEELVGALENGQVEEAVAVMDRIVGEGYDLIEFYHGLVVYVRGRLRQAMEGETESPDGREFLRMLNLLLSREGQFRHAPNQQVYLEALMVRLALQPRAVQIDEILGHLGLGEGGGASRRVASRRASGRGGQSKPAARTSGTAEGEAKGSRERIEVKDRTSQSDRKDQPTVSDHPHVSVGHREPLTLEEVERAWPEIRRGVARERAALSLALEAARPVRVEGPNTLVLAVGAEEHSAADQLNESQNRSLVERAMAQMLGRVFTVRAEAEGGRSEKVRPVLEEVMDLFDAEIVE